MMTDKRRKEGEESVLATVYEMSIESLSPDNMSEIERILVQLAKTRHVQFKVFEGND